MLFKIMDYTGHTSITFSPAQREAARAKFDELVAGGKIAYAPAGEPGAHRLLREFDPEAETTLFRPQLVGG